MTMYEIFGFQEKLSFIDFLVFIVALRGFSTHMKRLYSLP